MGFLELLWENLGLAVFTVMSLTLSLYLGYSMIAPERF
jgi:hypothetical protein